MTQSSLCDKHTNLLVFSLHIVVLLYYPRHLSHSILLPRIHEMHHLLMSHVHDFTSYLQVADTLRMLNVSLSEWSDTIELFMLVPGNPGGSSLAANLP